MLTTTSHSLLTPQRANATPSVRDGIVSLPFSSPRTPTLRAGFDSMHRPTVQDNHSAAPGGVGMDLTTISSSLQQPRQTVNYRTSDNSPIQVDSHDDSADSIEESIRRVSNDSTRAKSPPHQPQPPPGRLETPLDKTNESALAGPSRPLQRLFAPGLARTLPPDLFDTPKDDDAGRKKKKKGRKGMAKSSLIQNRLKAAHGNTHESRPGESTDGRAPRPMILTFPITSFQPLPERKGSERKIETASKKKVGVPPKVLAEAIEATMTTEPPKSPEERQPDPEMAPESAQANEASPVQNRYRLIDDGSDEAGPSPDTTPWIEPSVPLASPPPVVADTMEMRRARKLITSDKRFGMVLDILHVSRIYLVSHSFPVFG